MANFNELAQWVTDVYRLATTDPVLGGDSNAPSNRGLAAVVNRTAWLKSELEKLQEKVANIYFIGQIIELAPGAYNSADYDGTGLGRTGTPAEHWARCNGQNGTVNKEGLLTAGFGPGTLNYGTPGQAGGSDSFTLAAGNIPQLSLNTNNKITDGDPNRGDGAALFLASPTTSNQASGKKIAGTVGTPNPAPIKLLLPYVTAVFLQRVSN